MHPNTQVITQTSQVLTGILSKTINAPQAIIALVQLNQLMINLVK